MRMVNSPYHIPVLLHKAIDGLSINPDGVYVDATFGGGGHSCEILKKIDQGRLLAFDQDPDAEQNVPDDKKLTFIKSNFIFLKNFIRYYEIEGVDGILADLGVSSYQFDTGARGFSTRFDSKLDMRMSQDQKLSAIDVLNSYSLDDIKRVLKEYGEIRNPGKIAHIIGKSREESLITTVGQLKKLLQPFTPKKKEAQFFAQVFQALRIEVNAELEALKDFLNQCTEVLKPGGRLVVISYHSLEDRLVKNFIKRGNFEGEVEKDFYGNPIKDFKEITRKPIVPDEEEVQVNSRARSAKMRIAEKVDVQKEKK